MKTFLQKIIDFFKYRYNHKCCTIKKFSTYPGKKPQLIAFKGQTVTLEPGKYSVSCKTYFGWRMKYLKLTHRTSINIKELVTK